MRSRIPLTLALAGLVLLSASGCAQIKAAITPAPTIKHVTIAAKVAKPDATIQGTLKPGKPETLPLWDGAGVLHTKLVKSDAGTSWQATLTTPDPFADVVTGMAAGLQTAGWQAESTDASSADSSITVLTVTGPSATGVITISSQPDKSTHIDYVITTSK